jgi:hypothetical protein
MHDRTRIERCHNSEIGTHILEGKVFEMIFHEIPSGLTFLASLCLMGDRIPK